MEGVSGFGIGVDRPLRAGLGTGTDASPCASKLSWSEWATARDGDSEFERDADSESLCECGCGRRG